MNIKRITIVAILFIQSIVISQPTTPQWAYDATIYEVNIRQFTDQGTFEAFQNHLPRLKELGVDILWLMPINPIGEKNRKGTLGSYYSVKDYKEINPEFGTKEDFQKLVEEIHKQGMYVIVDWVANHTAWDNPWVKEHPEFYTKDSLGNFIPPVADWADVIDLNFDNKELWEEMIDALKYWVSEFDIDGYRCDVAGMVPSEFWNQARAELETIKPVFMLAEWETPELHEKAFNMTYGWEVHKMMNYIYKGEKKSSDLKVLILKDKQHYPDNAFRMQFTSNHDENSWNGTEFERLGNAAEMFAVLTYVIPGMPLIYSGQEVGFNERLDFFEKDLIIWKESPFKKLYTKLNDLKKNNRALWNGKYGGTIEFLDGNPQEDIFILVRSTDENKLLGLFNMSNEEKFFSFNPKDNEGRYSDFTDGTEKEITGKMEIKLKPWSYKLFSK